MFTYREERDVPEHHHPTVTLVEACRKRRRRVLAQPRKELGVHAGDALGGVCEALPGGVVSQGLHDLGGGFFDALSVYQPPPPIGSGES